MLCHTADGGLGLAAERQGNAGGSHALKISGNAISAREACPNGEEPISGNDQQCMHVATLMQEQSASVVRLVSGSAVMVGGFARFLCRKHGVSCCNNNTVELG